MGPTRFPFGQARGFANQFYTNKGATAAAGLQVAGTAGDISGSATPDVTLGELFYTNNTAALTITNFVLQDTANRAASYEGKVIRVIALESNTSYAGGGPINLAGTDNLLGTNVQAEFMFSRGQWWQSDVSKVGSDVTTFVTNAQSSLNMTGVRVALLNNTGSTTNSIIGLSGGYVGQEVTFMAVGSNAVRILAGGNIFMTVTNAVLINASGAYKFVNFNGATWRGLAVNSGGAL